FQDCSENSSYEVTTASSTVPTVGQNSLNNTNTFSVVGPSNTTVSPTYGDASQFPNDLDMSGLEDIIYSDDKDVVGAEAISTIWNLLFQRNPKGYIKLSKILVRLKPCKKSFFNSKCKKFGS
nr:hypothetical protein [Tanacetum cinerariifolium]